MDCHHLLERCIAPRLKYGVYTASQCYSSKISDIICCAYAKLGITCNECTLNHTQAKTLHGSSICIHLPAKEKLSWLLWSYQRLQGYNIYNISMVSYALRNSWYNYQNISNPNLAHWLPQCTHLVRPENISKQLITITSDSLQQFPRDLLSWLMATTTTRMMLHTTTHRLPRHKTYMGEK